MKIKSNIPKPQKGAGAPIKYPFEKMKLGDCFKYKIKPGENLNNIQRSILSTARQRGFRVSTRCSDGVVTVWLEKDKTRSGRKMVKDMTKDPTKCVNCGNAHLLKRHDAGNLREFLRLCKKCFKIRLDNELPENES